MSTDIRAGLVACAILLVAGVAAVVVHSEDRAFDAESAVRCIERIGDRLGYDVAHTSADRAGDAFDVTGVAADGVLRARVRAVDGHVLDVALIPQGGAVKNAITRQQRLAAFEVECRP